MFVLKMNAETCLLVLLTIAISFVGSYGADTKGCIHNKFKASIGSEGYTACYEKSGATDIPKMKQCYQGVMKTRKVVKVAPNGQMTVDKAKFQEAATSLNKNAVGKAMVVCHQKSNNDDMYKEAARATQCVFEELKKGC